MTEDSNSGDRYSIGDVGDNTRIMQGKDQNWLEFIDTSPDSKVFENQVKILLEDIYNDKFQTNVEKSISINKTQQIIRSLGNIQKSPKELETALIDGRTWYDTKASWVWGRLRDILKTDVAQKTIATITENSMKGAIQGLLR